MSVYGASASRRRDTRNDLLDADLLPPVGTNSERHDVKTTPSRFIIALFSL